jgi:hypothetical protein
MSNPLPSGGEFPSTYHYAAKRHRSQGMICHSVDYIYMQPPLTKDQWQAEVVKMKKVFGAPVPDGEVDTIVEYLMSQDGKK